MDIGSPALGKDRFICPRCGAFSAHIWSKLEIRASHPSNGNITFWDFADAATAFAVVGRIVSYAGAPGKNIWASSLCASCSAACVWRGENLIYPAVSAIPSPHPDMPGGARELYQEASAVLPISRRAAAALARAALENFLREFEGANPKDRLDDLIAGLEGRVTGALWQLLTGLRVLGNDSLHGDEDALVTLYLTGEISEVAEPFFGAINALVEELITQPQKAKALYEMIPEGKRAAAEEKAKRSNTA